VQYNHVSFAAGYASSSAVPTHFGLGPAASASLIEIRWPSGIVQELKDVSADRVIRVKERTDSLRQRFSRSQRMQVHACT
jgi:hypothetical protein